MSIHELIIEIESLEQQVKRLNITADTVKLFKTLQVLSILRRTLLALLIAERKVA